MQGGQICYSECICCIVWFWYIREPKEEFYRILHLAFFGEPITSNPLLYFERSKFADPNTSRHKRMKDDSACMGDIDPIRNILKEKKSLDTTHRRLICIDNL